jgi:hypothetical protein
MRVLPLVLLAACTEPVVEMELLLPKNADGFDTSCIKAVEVHATGAKIAQQGDDFEMACIELSGGGASYAAIRDEIKGQFDLSIPESGLSGVEVYGWSGPNPCNTEYPNATYMFGTPDLLFLGRGNYIGQDKVEIPLMPTLSCAETPVKIRMYDMIALVKGATCDAAGTMQLGGAGVGTLVPRTIGKGVDIYGTYLEGGNSTGNTVTFSGPMQAGGSACLAIDGGSNDPANPMTGLAGTTSCYNGGASVCAGAGEIEHPMIPFDIMYNKNTYDNTLLGKFPGVTLGSVWTNATPRTTLAGAKVTVDATHGTVVYVDPPDANGVMVKRADQTQTGPSGLFLLYADTVVTVKVEGNGGMRTLQLASASDRTAGALIVVGP